MSLDRLAPLARALLYEGYVLYPYRPSALKNQYRWSFGTLYPRAFCEGPDGDGLWWMQTECLVRASATMALEVAVRFLHLAEPVGEPASPRPWQQAAERGVAAERLLADLLHRPATIPFAFRDAEAAPSGPVSRHEPIDGALELSAARAGGDLVRLTVVIRNLTAFAATGPGQRIERRDAALRRALVSTHTLLGARGGEFISLLSPPEAACAAAAACRNVGTWPVLAGAAGARDAMLSSPIVLPDYPRLAPESAGDFFDATEIDELLTLRLLTLTDQEKQDMRSADPRTRALLDRAEAAGHDDLARLHGAVRARRSAEASRGTLRPGGQVRLTPRRGADILDLALAGKTATIVSIEEDYEGRIFVAVALDDDPGRDLGAEGLPGHRFFFRPDEVEPLP